MPPRVLILYTGGTFGMASRSGGEGPLSIPKLSNAMLSRNLRDRVPELASLAKCDIEILFNRDSAHIGPKDWLQIAKHIQSQWKKYDGFVVLHGTDTLAYTASALSFLLRPCKKPVVLTGAQKPLSAIRTDARRNLISAVEIASKGPRPLVNRVSVFFDDRLLQGNRARKRSSTEFAAFDSPKAPPLALVGTRISYEGSSNRILNDRMTAAFSEEVALVHLTPGFPACAIKAALEKLSGLVLIAFPSGTAPTNSPELLSLISEAKEKNIPVVLVTDDSNRARSANPALYAAGQGLLKAGCLWADQMTLEAAYVKTCWLLAQPSGAHRFRSLWKRNFAGESV